MILDELAKLEQAATKGPWRWSDRMEISVDGRDCPSLLAGGGYGVLSCDGPHNGPKHADAALIAAARNALPALIRIAQAAERIQKIVRRDNIEFPRDNACDECCPEPYCRDLVMSGFRCSKHALDSALRELEEVKNG